MDRFLRVCDDGSGCPHGWAGAIDVTGIEPVIAALGGRFEPDEPPDRLQPNPTLPRLNRRATAWPAPDFWIEGFTKR